MQTNVQVQTIQITHNENHLSLANTVLGKNSLLYLVDKKNTGYSLHVQQLGKEDGSGNRFLFKARLVAITKQGEKISVNQQKPFHYKGYIDLRNKTGWIEFNSEGPVW